MCINFFKSKVSSNQKLVCLIFAFSGFVLITPRIYRIDNLVKASTCTIVGTASIDGQISLVADVGIFEM
jgi:hypothetical protein